MGVVGGGGVSVGRERGRESEAGKNKRPRARSLWATPPRLQSLFHAPAPIAMDVGDMSAPARGVGGDAGRAEGRQEGGTGVLHPS